MTYEIPTFLPEPTSTQTKNGKDGYGQVQRSVETRWVLNPEEEGVPTVFVRLTTFHWPERKVYSTLMTWGTHQPAKGSSVFSVETWGSDHKSVRVHTSRVARHSLNAMQDHHTEAMAIITEDFGKGVVEEIFAEAAERNGLLVTEEA